MELKTKTRLHALDALRGFMMINMILYHGMWNLKYLFGVPCDWYAGTTKYLWQQCICWTFIILSGFCWSLSKNHLRRGGLVFGGGVLVSLVTNLLMYENRIVFGQQALRDFVRIGVQAYAQETAFPPDLFEKFR